MQHMAHPGASARSDTSAPSLEIAASLYARGPQPLRVLLLGDGPAAEQSTASYEAAFGAQLGPAIAAQASRAVVVDVRADRRMTPDVAYRVAKRTDLARYDAIVVTLGSSDAARLVPARSFIQSMARLLDYLETATRGRVPISIGSIPEPRSRADGGTGALHAAHRERLNSALMHSALPVTMTAVSLDRDGADAETTTARHRRWAAELARGLHGDEIQPRAAALPTRRDERRRQESLHRSGVLRTADLDPFEDIVRGLQLQVDMPIVSLNFIADDLLWVKVARGFPLGAYDRSDSICNTTIQDSTPLVVPNLLVDPRFAENPYVHTPGGLQSYAGHPIEAADGERIGSLCVLDTRPRELSRQDVLTLHEFAFRAQRQIHAMR